MSLNHAELLAAIISCFLCYILFLSYFSLSVAVRMFGSCNNLYILHLCTGYTEMSKSVSSEDVNYSYGQCISGFVYKIDPEWAWLTVSRDFMAQLYILDSSCEPSELGNFQKRFHVGKAISGFVINVNKEKKLLRVVLHSPLDGYGELKGTDSDLQSLCHLVEGSVVGGRVSKILPGVGGLVVQIDQHRYGKVHFTELTDSWVSNPLSEYQEGGFVKCRVLEINRALKGNVHVDLSLRSSQDASTEHDGM